MPGRCRKTVAKHSNSLQYSLEIVINGNYKQYRNITAKQYAKGYATDDAAGYADGNIDLLTLWQGLCEAPAEGSIS